MNPKKAGIYCIENTWTEKFYIGSSRDVDARIKRHIKMLRDGAHHSIKLQNSWNKYGEGVFEFGVLVLCEEVDLLQREQEMIVTFDAVDNGYNVSKRAGAPMRGRKTSDEAKVKMREAHKARKPISEETRQRLRDAAKEREKMKKANGFEVSQETRDRLSKAGAGRVFTEETKAKISAANSGKPLSEEHRQKLSDARKGRERTQAEIDGRKSAAESNTGRARSDEFKSRMSELASNRTEEHRQKLADSLRGRKLSEEHRKALSDARKRNHEASVIDELA